MFKRFFDKYFVIIGLVITGAIVLTWDYLLTIYPFITLSIILITAGAIVFAKKIRRKKSS